MAASLEQLANRTANEAYTRGWPFTEAQLESHGYQFPPDLPREQRGPHLLNSNQKYNGGVGASIFARLDTGERVFRFSDSKKAPTLEARARGFWWFDYECYLTLRKLGGTNDVRFREAARSNLAVLPEWGDMANLVTGLVRKPYWVIKGMTAPAAGKSDKISGHFSLDVLQIYVPGGLALADLSEPSDSVLTRTAY